MEVPEVAFLRWQKEKVGRSEFSQMCLLKGLGISNEISRQQVQSKQGGGCFPQHRVLVFRGPAPPAALPVGHRNGLTKRLQKVMDKKPFESYYLQRNGYFSWLRNPLILVCQKLVRAAWGGPPVLMP